ncbi:mechanosensitive ion channel [Candidatus Woesearchaeota archaeon]|nr:mechanosensitive ion channel [Candidatus Woesearchaeota archaeon]
MQDNLYFISKQIQRYINIFLLVFSMVEWNSVLSAIDGKFLPLIRTIVIVVLAFLVFNIVLSAVKGYLKKRAKTKKHISNIEIFSKVIKYIFTIVLVLIAIFTYAGSWTGFGLSVGLFSAALGWALQRPITGIAGWIMVVVKRPFEIGDRVIIGNVRGDVIDITLTHVYINEIGGIIGGEENSGRVTLVPNSKLFEQDITNYTLSDDYMLDQVAFTVTYEGNLDKAIKIALDAGKNQTKEFLDKMEKKPYVFTYFGANGIDVKLRYMSPAKRLQEFSSRITKEIFDGISAAKDVEIAYPHTEVILRQKEILRDNS